MKLVKNWKQYLKELADPESIDISSLKIKDYLNPDLWDNDQKLKTEIGDRLYDIAKNFFTNLDLDWVDLLDVTITGSIANYNWSKYSDIDLHIIIDYDQVDENKELVNDYLRKSSAGWNRLHGIKIKEFEVEVYLQDSNEPHYSTGVYSVKNDKWITTPIKRDPKIDWENVKKKSSSLMDNIDEVYELFSNKNFKEALTLAEKIKEKIRKFRQSGLESAGEYSIENLAFKVLRRNNYLYKLSSLKITAYDKIMSINGI